MIRTAALGLAAAGLLALPLAADAGAIRGGEHADFTRLVLPLEPGSEWSLATGTRRATLRFPGQELAFATGGTFEKIPRTRVTEVRAARDAKGTTVTIELGCDCPVSATLVGTRYLAIDVSDARKEPEADPQEPPAERARREARLVASAEDALLAQIERAVDQGVVQLSEAGAPPARPHHGPGPAKVREGLEALLQHEQIAATTVYDRDGHEAGTRTPEPKVPEVCIPDDRLDLDAWSDGDPLPAQIAALRADLVGEFDAANPTAVADLARLYIRHGFGAEAGALLRAFGAANLPDRALLADLARVVDGGTASATGPLGLAVPCPGRHGLWQALGGVRPVFEDRARTEAVAGTFGTLPVDLRVLLAPRFAGRLVEAGHPEAARVIHDTAVRPGFPETPELLVGSARLAAAEGEPEAAIAGLGRLLARDGHAPLDALRVFARLSLDAGLPIGDDLLTDLEAASLLSRGSTDEASLRGLAVEALARRGDLAAAVREARAAVAEVPSGSEDFAALAVRVLGGADPAAVGEVRYVETVLSAGDLVGRSPAGDPARTAIAGRLLDLGLPDPALIILAPALATGDERARLLAARARLELGDGENARAALGTLQGPEATALRARAFAQAGDYGEALRALGDRDMVVEAAPYVWPSGDWARVHAKAGGDPARLAMAGYMTAATGAAPARAPAADPGALGREEAFQEPLPALNRPSLDAARRLVAAGPQVGGFLRDVLAEE